MMNQGQTALHKALLYLDLGKLELGELNLKQAIEAADAEEDQTTYIRAAVCYGEWLCEMERAREASKWLRLAIERSALSPHSDADVLDEEINRARELLE